MTHIPTGTQSYLQDKQSTVQHQAAQSIRRSKQCCQEKTCSSPSCLLRPFSLNTFFHGDPGCPSPIIDREVKLPAQAADDTVVRCTGGKIVQFILREGDGVDARTDVPILQVEPQCDVQLSLFVLNDSQIFQVALQKPIQRFQLVGVQQAIVNCSMENTRM